MDRAIEEIGMDAETFVFHAGPLIRREQGYEFMEFIESHKTMFDQLVSVKVYYDCGQSTITNILHDVFGRLPFLKVEFAQDVRPAKYRLFQLADLVCTLNLIALKLSSGMAMSRSESKFFGGPKAFRHNVLRRIKSKEI